MQIYLSPFNFQLFHLFTYYLCVHMYCKLVFCVCPLYIPLTCNVCPLYIPFPCIMSVPSTFILLVMSVPCTFLSLLLSVCLQYRCTQNQFKVPVYTKPVYGIGVIKTSSYYSFTQTSLLYMYTQNQIRVHLLNSLLKVCLR